MSSTYMLTWNPKRFVWGTLARDARRTIAGESVTTWWSCGTTKRIVPGDRLFVMRLGMDPRGIVASGWALSEPELRPHWEDERAALGDQGLFVEIEFEHLLDLNDDEPLLQSDLRALAPAFHWTPQASGVQFPSEVAASVEAAWAVHLARAVVSEDRGSEPSAYREGELQLSVVRHRRREQRIRKEKISARLAETGRLVCEVPTCGFDFERVYGSMAHGYAQVHHLKPLSSFETPRLTTQGDVVIVCANCHAMIHHGGECRPLAGLIHQE